MMDIFEFRVEAYLSSSRSRWALVVVVDAQDDRHEVGFHHDGALWAGQATSSSKAPLQQTPCDRLPGE